MTNKERYHYGEGYSPDFDTMDYDRQIKELKSAERQFENLKKSLNEDEFEELFGDRYRNFLEKIKISL